MLAMLREIKYSPATSEIGDRFWLVLLQANKLIEDWSFGTSSALASFTAFEIPGKHVALNLYDRRALHHSGKQRLPYHTIVVVHLGPIQISPKLIAEHHTILTADCNTHIISACFILHDGRSSTTTREPLC